MIHHYSYDDEISRVHIAEALPSSKSESLPIWTHTWSEIVNLKSTVFGFEISSDEWKFPIEQFATGSRAKITTSLRMISFSHLRETADPEIASQIVCRAKRLVWLYVHQPRDKIFRAVTMCSNAQNFLLIVSKICAAKKFTFMPDDRCPDGPFFFRELLQKDFELIVPIEKGMRNGIRILDFLPDEIDDRLGFAADSYSKNRELKVRRNKIAKGLHPESVSINAVDDENLSRVLALCETYRKYPGALVTIWDWLNKHRMLANESGQGTNVYAPGNKRQKTNDTFKIFQSELLHKNIDYWIEVGFVINKEGTLANPVFPHLGPLIRTVWDVANVRSLKTCIATCIYSNAIYISFLTAMRTQELTALPFDPLVPNDELQRKFSYIIGRELKANDQVDGLVRDWPLPNVAVSLIEGTQILQMLRSRVLERPLPQQLFDWYPQVPLTFMRLLKEELDYCGPRDNLLKRMRPSSAQLVADIGRSPLSVQRVLGHSNIEQSLGYLRGRPDEEYWEDVAQQKREKDRALGRKMIAEVVANGATKRMTDGVIKMAIDQIVALKIGDEVSLQRATELQSRIEKIEPSSFSEVYEIIGENRWVVDEFIGESVTMPRPFQFCTAKKGGVQFSGSCSKSDSIVDQRNCKSYCPYNFEANASLELRAEWIELELSKGHFESDEITTEDPVFYYSAMKVLDWLWSLEGPLAKFKNDERIISIIARIEDDKDLLSLFKGESRRTMQELSAG